MPPTKGPIVPRKRLGNELKRLREESGQTLDGVAQTLMISTSKLSRLENAQGSPQMRDVRDLAVYYGVSDKPLGRRLMAWAREGRQMGWWADYEDIIQQNESFDVYLAYETEAKIARVYTIPYITGLLQTAEYTRALTKAMWPWHTAEEIDRFVQLRLRRQDGLKHREGRPPLELRAIIHESCLAQLVGSPVVMREQLDALLSAPSKFPRIDLRVLPSRAEPHLMNTCTWSYFIFEELDRDVVHLETHAGYRHIEDVETIKRYDRAFFDMTERSLDPDESAKLIHSMLQHW
jgi:transcriptional regulator with XRE-family HTH domain